MTEMEDWLAALASASQRTNEPDQPDFLAGYHHWYASSHARPTYCNVCREALTGVTSHGLSCEVCKCKVHKRCAAKAINNCKWTTLSSVGKDIIEEKDGSITMPHQWIEGNLPVSAKCLQCEKNCGSVLRLQDWRCLWCRGTIHTACRPLYNPACPLGPARVSVVPPTALHCIQDEAWDAIRPQASSPLLVFVNSKSGDNQGIKFLRRFKQLLNPAQVFDLISSGPRLGLRLFRHFDPFRILVCSGDGSVGWVLSEIDKLDMQKQCQLAVLPLGTGNDLARVLGWGSSCDDDTHLPQLLEKYEKASTKMLDRWSIMTFERTIAMHKIQPITIQSDPTNIKLKLAECENSIASDLHTILHSDETSQVLSSTKHLCNSVKDVITQIPKVDNQFESRCKALNEKLDLLLHTLTTEEDVRGHEEAKEAKRLEDLSNTESAVLKDTKTEKNLQTMFKKMRRESIEKQKGVRQKDQLLRRANSLKRAIQCLREHADSCTEEPKKTVKQMDTLKVLSPIDSNSSGEPSPNLSPRISPSPSLSSQPIVSISPLPEIHRFSVCEETNNLLSTLPVPTEFADSRRSSEARPGSVVMDQLLTPETALTISSCCSDLDIVGGMSSNNGSISQQTVIFNKQDQPRKNSDPVAFSDKDDSSIMSSVLSQDDEDMLLSDDLYLENSFCPAKGSDGEDVNGHIYHIDSPETSDTFPNSEPLHLGESIMDDVSSMLAQDVIVSGHPKNIDDDSIGTSYTDDTTLFNETQKQLDIEAQYGFENRVFMQQNVFFNDIPAKSVRYCSLAQFVEGNDIARKSFRRRKSVKKYQIKTEADSLSTIDDEILQVHITENEEEEEIGNNIFPKVSVIVEPPSPVHSDQNPSSERMCRNSLSNLSAQSIIIDFQNQDQSKASGASPAISQNSSNSNLLTIDYNIGSNYFLKGSPAATRRISCGSLLKAGESAMLAASIDNQAFYVGKETLSGQSTEKKVKVEDEKKQQVKTLPIINPLVRLPQWPNVGTGAGFIGQCLLANADTLCAAVSPLMDPDETLLEGFIERCVMNNYFGIGIDAKISLDFHNKREEHPEKCRSRAKNYMWYGVLGSKQWLQRTFKNLEQRVQLECDGQRIPLPELQGIVILNIPSFMGGTNFWGGRKEDEIFLAPSFDDKILEVVAVFGSVQMAASRLINLQHHRIAQCQSIQINILGEEGVPVQVDGEAWIQPPGMIRIIHKNRMQMLCRNRALENSLKSWEEKQRHNEHSSSTNGEKSRNSSLTLHRPSVTLPRHSIGNTTINFTDKMRSNGRQSFSRASNCGAVLTIPPQQHYYHYEKSHSITYIENMPPPDVSLTDDEHNLLLSFIECATNLVKFVKIFAISNPNLEVDLYSLALKIEHCFEQIHPNGKLLVGNSLREELTTLYGHVKQLFEETCCLLRDKENHYKLREDLESKLSITLANTEMELRKCIMAETPKGNLIFLHQVTDEQPDRKKGNKGLFWSKFRGKSPHHSSTQASGSTAKDVATWGTLEVCTWLETLQLGEYTETFIRNDIRGRELLTLARRDIKELGVTKVGHVKRILQAIKDLNDN